MDRPDLALRGGVRRGPRRIHRQRRPSEHRQGSPLLRSEPPLGGQRILDRLRRLLAAWRPRRRPARQAARLHGRADRYCGRVASRGVRHQSRRADRWPCRAGLGRAAILSPAALSIVANLFREGAERNKAFGAWGAVAGSAGAVGVLLGGALTSGLSWRWVLWVTVPVALIALALTPGLIPEHHPESETRHFDARGAVSITAGLTLLAYAMLDASSAGWGSTKIVGLLAAAVVLIALFIAIELRSPSPLVPFRLFRLRTLTGANVVGILLGASLFSMFYFISLYMQQVLHYSPIHAGLSYLPLAATIFFAAGFGGQLVTRFGFKPILATGMLFTAGGLVYFSRGGAGGGRLAGILRPPPLAAHRLRFNL